MVTCPSNGILNSRVPLVIAFLVFLDLASLTCGLISVSTGVGSGNGATCVGGKGGGGAGGKGGGGAGAGGVPCLNGPTHIRFLPP